MFRTRDLMVKGKYQTKNLDSKKVQVLSGAPWESHFSYYVENLTPEATRPLEINSSKSLNEYKHVASFQALICQMRIFKL